LSYNIGIDARRLRDPGIGHYVQRLVRALAEIDGNNSYSLFVGSLYDGELDDLPDNFARVNEGSPIYSFRERVALSWRQVRQRLDLYHATHYILPLWLPKRTVTTVHDILHLLYPEFMPGRLSRYVAPAQIRRTLARSDHMITESQNTKTDLVDYFDVRPSRVSRVYPGVDPSFSPEPEPSDPEILKELGLGGRYVLFRGAPGTHKNEESALRAVAAAAARTTEDFELVCVGERESSLERLAHLERALGLEGRVQWLGELPEDQMPAVLRGARLLIYPTLYEGFPMPVVEGMACGVPVITSNKATIREVAEGSAKLVDASSVSSLGGAIGWCLNDPQLTANLATDGLRRAAEFRWRRVAEQTLAIYEGVLGSDRSPLTSSGEAV